MWGGIQGPMTAGRMSLGLLVHWEHDSEFCYDGGGRESKGGEETDCRGNVGDCTLVPTGLNRVYFSRSGVAVLTRRNFGSPCCSIADYERQRRWLDRDSHAVKKSMCPHVQLKSPEMCLEHTINLWDNLRQPEAVESFPPRSLRVCLFHLLAPSFVHLAHIQLPVEVEHSHDEVRKSTKTSFIADSSSLETVLLL